MAAHSAVSAPTSGRVGLVESVAAEAKVVSFWPFRQAWVQELDGLGVTTLSLPPRR